MQGRNGGKDIGVAPVDAFEDRNAQQLVKASQAGYIARRGEIRLKTIVHGIPGRSGRMDVIAGKAYQIDQQEHHRKTQVKAAAPLEVKPKAESDGHRHPAEVENTGHEIGRTAMVEGEIFAGNQRLPACLDAKQRLLGLVKAADVNGIDFIIGPHTHPVVGHAEYDKRQQGHSQLAGGPSGKKQQQEQPHQQEMLGTDAHKHARQQQEQGRHHKNRQGLPCRRQNILFHPIIASSTVYDNG